MPEKEERNIVILKNSTYFDEKKGKKKGVGESATVSGRCFGVKNKASFVAWEEK